MRAGSISDAMWGLYVSRNSSLTTHGCKTQHRRSRGTRGHASSIVTRYAYTGSSSTPSSKQPSLARNCA
eukprot:8015089-Pyramimonas_sp.AAC.1